MLVNYLDLSLDYIPNLDERLKTEHYPSSAKITLLRGRLDDGTTFEELRLQVVESLPGTVMKMPYGAEGIDEIVAELKKSANSQGVS